jgi:acyl carrier protein
MNIIEEVKNFLYDENLKRQFKILGNTDSLLENGIIDSVKMLELIAFLEEKYSIKVDDDDLYPENFDTLDSIQDYVRRRMND